MNAVAIITARGGSKRIPRKNVKEFLGKPILLYSIEAALNSGIFEEVMVSTEDEEIAELARKAGATVPFMRGEENANDYATTTDVLLEVVAEYEKRGKHFEFGCCIYPTAPFVTADKLKEGMERLASSDADTLMPVVPFSFLPQRGMVIRDDKLQFVQPEHALTRSQDLEPWYHDVGQFYCFRIENFKKNRILTVGNVLPLVVSELEVQDIDTIADWKIAEMKYEAMMEKK
ncbi:MAG: pseudaminic acid cytidylyltransferase [Lachnospiraceae bacterium]|nr:pseudaminic acid cytidylyltransferase [Lachnospiraceae bacterium]